jgi:hypothetical protein
MDAHLGQLALRHVQGLRLHIRQRRPVLRHLRHRRVRSQESGIVPCWARCSFQMAPFDCACQKRIRSDLPLPDLAVRRELPSPWESQPHPALRRTRVSSSRIELSDLMADQSQQLDMMAQDDSSSTF